MTGDLQPVVGDVRPHAHLRISKFSQHFIDVLDLNANPLDYFMTLWPDMTREEGRKFLGRYGISGGVQTQVGNSDTCTCALTTTNHIFSSIHNRPLCPQSN